MFTLDVRADFSGIQAKLNAMKAGLGDKVIVATLNETITQARTKAIKGITDVYNIKASEVRNQTHISLASRKGQHFQATLYGKQAGAKWSQNIARFLLTKGQVRRANKAARLAKAFGGRATYDVQAEVRKGSMRTVQGGFLITAKNGTTFVAYREGGRLHSAQTVGVPQMFDRPSVQKPIIAWLPGKFREIFDRRMRYFVSTLK